MFVRRNVVARFGRWRRRSCRPRNPGLVMINFPFNYAELRSFPVLLLHASFIFFLSLRFSWLRFVLHHFALLLFVSRTGIYVLKVSLGFLKRRVFWSCCSSCMLPSCFICMLLFLLSFSGVFVTRLVPYCAFGTS